MNKITDWDGLLMKQYFNSSFQKLEKTKEASGNNAILDWVMAHYFKPLNHWNSGIHVWRFLEEKTTDKEFMKTNFARVFGRLDTYDELFISIKNLFPQINFNSTIDSFEKEITLNNLPFINIISYQK